MATLVLPSLQYLELGFPSIWLSSTWPSILTLMFLSFFSQKVLFKHALRRLTHNIQSQKPCAALTPLQFWLTRSHLMTVPLLTNTWRVYSAAHLFLSGALEFVSHHETLSLRFRRSRPRTISVYFIGCICLFVYIYVFPSGADVRPKFHWGFSYVVICSGYISDCFRVCLGLV